MLEVRHEWAARAAAHAGLTHAAVPNTFPSGYLDRIRRDGVELTVDQAVFDARRRVKAGAELDGIRRAQRAAEAGLAAGVSLMRQAENGDGVLWLDGEPLTVERVKAAMRRVFAEHGCTAEDFVVAPGPQGAAGHEMGHGPIGFGDPVVFDLWPRDDASSCFADMTRTIVAGPVSDQVREWHTLTKAALDCGDRAHPGGRRIAASVFDAACEVYEAAGYPTQRTKTAGEVLDRGFFHGLGHGVGLEVHEGPYMGLLPGGTLVAGDVVTVEPGCYDPAIGGVRLEDLVLVTDDGCEVLTRFPYDLEVATDVSDHTIETLSDEERRFPPSPAFAAQANAGAEIYDEPFEAFWERNGRERVTWFEPFGELYRWELPYAQWYLGGKLNVAYNCVDRHVEAGPRRPRRVPLGRRAGGRHAHDHLRRAPARRGADGECAEGDRRRQGHRGRDLHGDGARARRRDARLHAPRRAAHGRLRRLLGGLALGPDERHGLRGARHAGRGVAARQAGAAEARRGRRDGRRARRAGLARRPPDGEPGADDRRPRPLVPRPRGAGLRRSRDVPVRADGQRGPAVPDVHVGDDGEAEGDRAHDGRLPRRRRDDALARSST